MRQPEDCGGPFGYGEKREALAEPQHEYHEEALETLGDDHDPKANPDIPVIGARLGALAKRLGTAETPESLIGRVNASFRRR